MRASKFFLFSVLCAAALLWTNAGAFADDPEPKAQSANEQTTIDPRVEDLKKEIVAGFENYVNRNGFQYVEGTTENESVYEGETTKTTSRVVRSGRNILLESDFKDGKYARIECVNKKYYFSLSQNDDGTYSQDFVERIDSPVAIDDFSPWTPPFSKNDHSAKENMLCGFAMIAARGYWAAGTWLFTLLDNPTLKLNSYEDETNADGERIVKFAFSCDSTPGCLVYGGELELLPDRFWQIKSGKVDLGGQTSVCNLEYQTPPETVPSDRSFDDVRLENGYKVVGNAKFTPLQKPLKDSRFTLSYYGLPEPKFDEEPAGRARYFVMLAGLVLIAVGALRIYKRRRAKADA